MLKRRYIVSIVGHKTRVCRDQQGSILLIALFVMMLLVSLGSMLIRLTATELEISEKFSAGISAYYAAEAGVKRALVEIDNQTMQYNFTEVLKNTSEYHVMIKDGSNKREKLITAVGKCGGTVRKAAAYVSLPDVPRFACFSGDNMILSAKVIGKVGLSGTHITITEGGSIVDLAGNSAEPELNSQDYSFPAVKTLFNENNYVNSQQLPGEHSNSSYCLKGSYYVDGDLVIKDAALSAQEHSSVTLFVKGKVEISGSISGNITIIATDSVILHGTQNAEGVLCIYSQKDIETDAALGQALLVSDGDINLRGAVHGVAIARGSAYVDSLIEGSVLAEKMLIESESGEVKYDERIFSSLGLTRPQIMAWDF